MNTHDCCSYDQPVAAGLFVICSLRCPVLEATISSEHSLLSSLALYLHMHMSTLHVTVYMSPEADQLQQHPSTHDCSCNSQQQAGCYPLLPDNQLGCMASCRNLLYFNQMSSRMAAKHVL
jgi:hypothetical protein